MQEELKEQGKALYVSLKENEADIRREMERVESVSADQEDSAEILGKDGAESTGRAGAPDTAAESGEAWQKLLESEMPPAQEVRTVVKADYKRGQQSCPGSCGERRKTSESVR